MEWEGMSISVPEVMDIIYECDRIILNDGTELDKMAPGINFSSKTDLSAFINENYPELDNKLERDTRGDYVLDVSSVKTLFIEYPWLKNLVNFRRAHKVKSTYMLSFLQFANDNKVHFSFSIQGTATGRLSCQNPNMQNIPKKIGDRKKDGYSLAVKSVFKPIEGHTLVNLDLATAEITMMALYSKDTNLINNLKTGLDFHSMTASQISNYSYEEIVEAKGISPDILTDRQKDALKMRSGAKAVSFGIPYGTSAKGMAQRQGWAVEYAEELIKKFFKLYPGVESWIESVKKEVKEK
jgi:DNA polymerase-1